MKSLREVLRLCEKTPSWEGLSIANVHQRNHLNDTVLHTVCSWGDADAVQAIVDAGADVNAAGDNGASPLFNAVIGEEPQVVRLLLKSGANPLTPNRQGTTVIQYAKNTGASEEIIKLLQSKTKPR